MKNITSRDFTFCRNASVIVEADTNNQGHPTARITVDDKFQHQFNAKSRISKALELVDPETLANRLTGGHYMFVDEQLVDFRDNTYPGFVHTDDTLNKLNEIIGIQIKGTNKPYVRIRNNLISDNIQLGTCWSDHNISVPEFQEGGDFSSQLHFGWNPFVKHINSAFMLYRLVCLNGMKGMTTFLNTKIPLINRWEEHLNIANQQIQNKVNSTVTIRLKQMGAERASVAETLHVANHATTRLSKNRDLAQSEMERLSNIVQVAHPARHLSKIYKSKVFEDKKLAAQMPAHLTVYDIYNIATEIRSHTTENANSSTLAMDMFANKLLFPTHSRSGVINNPQFAQPSLSPFSDPTSAFFGTITA